MRFGGLAFFVVCGGTALAGVPRASTQFRVERIKRLHRPPSPRRVPGGNGKGLRDNRRMWRGFSG